MDYKSFLEMKDDKGTNERELEFLKTCNNGDEYKLESELSKEIIIEGLRLLMKKCYVKSFKYLLEQVIEDFNKNDLNVLLSYIEVNDKEVYNRNIKMAEIIIDKCKCNKVELLREVEISRSMKLYNIIKEMVMKNDGENDENVIKDNEVKRDKDKIKDVYMNLMRNM